ncbi:MAG: hypothetical protein ACXVLO_04560, partial [Acidimicrobiia bacterium]
MRTNHAYPTGGPANPRPREVSTTGGAGHSRSRASSTEERLVERGSVQHGARMDDDLAEEVDGLLQGA